MVGDNLSPLIEIGLTENLGKAGKANALLALIQNVQLIPCLPV